MDVKEIINKCAETTIREKSNILFWAFWSYVRQQKDVNIKNQCIYECFCLVNNYMDSWDKKYQDFYERFLKLSVNEYGELQIAPINKEVEIAKSPYTQETKSNSESESDLKDKIIAIFESMKNSKK